jgi:hypothetical protein
MVSNVSLSLCSTWLIRLKLFAITVFLIAEFISLPINESPQSMSFAKGPLSSLISSVDLYCCKKLSLIYIFHIIVYFLLRYILNNFYINIMILY